MDNFRIRDQILQQLVRLDESRKAILDHHFPLPDRHQERKSAEILLERYVHRLEKLLFCLTHDPGYQLTFVIIGSTVTTRNKQLNTSETYKICYPDSADVGTECVSFVSPLGRQLLLAPIFTTVHVTVPDGEYEYVIEQITVPS